MKWLPRRRHEWFLNFDIRIRRVIGLIMGWGLLICCLAIPAPVAAVGQEGSDVDFTQFSLEELKGVKITSASRTPETVAEIPAAVFVITQDDIRRSGATSIPEALRMAPGVQVARVSATEWAVNIRGLNELYSNKLLVLMDGRTIYTHVYSGVFWDIQDTVMEDIDRIEIIRGPGAALWGANAVNGVINIITKKASKTQGGQWTVLGGNEEGIGTLRYGKGLGEHGYYRIYSKGFIRGSLFKGGDREIQNDPSKSDWRSGRAGFRVDWEPYEKQDSFTVQGETFLSRFDSVENRLSLVPPYSVAEDKQPDAFGAHVLGRWQRRIDEESDTALQFYYDYYDKDEGQGNVRVHTVDLDFQHRFTPFARNELVWGINSRFISDRFQDNFEVSTDPKSDDQWFYGLFFQDKVQLIPRYLHLVVGSKFEYNNVTGWEIQPNIRMLWSPGTDHFLWGAVSRAARVPSRLENDVRNNLAVVAPTPGESELPTLIQLIGGDNLDAETLIAYELGYRFEPASNLWISIAGFYNEYKDLINLHLNPERSTDADPVLHQMVSYDYDNNFDGESYGAELAVFWQPTGIWRLQGAYSYLETKMEPKAGGVEDSLEPVYIRQSNPRHVVSLRSSIDVTPEIEFDLWLRYVDRLNNQDVDDYTTMDARLSWKPAPLVELSLVGQNLLDRRHAEFSSLEIERSYYFKVDWCF